MTTANHQITLRLMQRLDNSRYFELRVPSNIRPHLSKLGIVEANQPTTVLRTKINTLAGAMAEELCEQYNDRLDPAIVAQIATRLFDDMNSETPLIAAGDEPKRTHGKWQ